MHQMVAHTSPWSIVRPEKKTKCPCCGTQVSERKLMVDEARSEVIFGGKVVRISHAGAPSTLRLISLLNNSYPGIVSMEEIVRSTWGDDLPADPKAGIRVRISRARAAIAETGIKILMAYGRGYRLILPQQVAS